MITVTVLINGVETSLSRNIILSRFKLGTDLTDNHKTRQYTTDATLRHTSNFLHATNVKNASVTGRSR